MLDCVGIDSSACSSRYRTELAMERKGVLATVMSWDGESRMISDLHDRGGQVGLSILWLLPP